MNTGKEHAYSTLMKMRKGELVQRYMALEHNLSVKEEQINNQELYIYDLLRQLEKEKEQ